MAVTSADMKLYKSAVVSDADSNGGACSANVINSGVRHSIFPRVTRAERLAGKTRYRKIFLKNTNSANETAAGVRAYLTFPSPAGDRFAMSDDQNLTQAEMIASDPWWTACGKLNVDAAIGATTLQVLFESTAIGDMSYSSIHISSNYKSAQVINTGVTPGASITYGVNGKWNLATHNGDAAYPNGIYLGDNVVMTDDGTASEEWLISTVDAITWVGNVATITLIAALSVAYTAATTYVSAALSFGDMVATSEITDSLSSAGTTDAVNNPVQCTNLNTIEDVVTVSFTALGAFTASGTISGSLGSGTVATDFTPVNPVTSAPYFTIPAAFWGGSWVLNDYIVLRMNSSGKALWLREIVPASTAQNANNLFAIGYYWE